MPLKNKSKEKKASKTRRYSLQAKDIDSKAQKENKSKILAVDNLNSSSHKGVWSCGILLHQLRRKA